MEIHQIISLIKVRGVEAVVHLVARLLVSLVEEEQTLHILHESLIRLVLLVNNFNFYWLWFRSNELGLLFLALGHERWFRFRLRLFSWGHKRLIIYWLDQSWVLLYFCS